jgi:hypothetical protein
MVLLLYFPSFCRQKSAHSFVTYILMLPSRFRHYRLTSYSSYQRQVFPASLHPLKHHKTLAIIPRYDLTLAPIQIPLVSDIKDVCISLDGPLKFFLSPFVTANLACHLTYDQLFANGILRQGYSDVCINCCF